MTLRRINGTRLNVVEDGTTDAEWARALAGRLGGAELVEIDAAGHLCNLERPDDINAVLRRFWVDAT